MSCNCVCFLFSSRRRHTRCYRDWSSDVCSSDLGRRCAHPREGREEQARPPLSGSGDRKSTRLNSSHGSISYAVLCLKTAAPKSEKKTTKPKTRQHKPSRPTPSRDRR